MRRGCAAALLAAALALAPAAGVAVAHEPPGARRPEPPPDAAVGRERFRATFVADGDTARGLWRGREEWVRLLRVNAPERGRAGSEEARADLVRWLGEGEVGLEFETPGAAARDVYGRLLAYLFVGGRNLSVELVRAGHSRFWTRYGEGRYAAQLRAAEAEARAAGRGLWSRGRRRGFGLRPRSPVPLSR